MAIRKVKYTGETDPVFCENGKTYDVITMFHGGYVVSLPSGGRSYLDDDEIEVVEQDDGEYDVDYGDYDEEYFDSEEEFEDFIEHFDERHIVEPERETA